MPISRNYCGLKVKQRESSGSIEFFVFAAEPKDIIQWSTIDRLEEREGGIQRRISKAKLRAIQRFFEKDPQNVTPTSMVVGFLPGLSNFRGINLSDFSEACSDTSGSNIEWGVLSFEYDPEAPEIQRPAFIVDGQHRLLGMAEVDEHLPIIVSALIDAESNEQAFQFIVINNKVTRVPADLVRSLIVDFNEEELQERLQTARVSLRPHALMVAIVDDEEESPFYEMVDWERRRGEGNPAVKPAAIEDSLKYIRRRFPSYDEDQDALLDFFFAMWIGIRNVYQQLWENIDNHLFENAGFKATTEYFTDQLEALSAIGYLDIFEMQIITNTSNDIASQINIGFWTNEWSLKSLDTSAGHEIIKDDIKLIRQNRKELKDWMEGLTLIGAREEE